MQLEPPEWLQDQLTFVRAAGNVSATVAPFAATSALVLVAMIVCVTCCPGTAVDWASVLVIAQVRGRLVLDRERQVVELDRVAGPAGHPDEELA